MGDQRAANSHSVQASPCSSSSTSTAHVPGARDENALSTTCACMGSASPEGGMSETKREGAMIRIVPTDLIVARIAPLSSLEPAALRTLIEQYDEDHVGGLSEEQWARFCRDRHQHILSLGEQMLDFDRSGEYTVTTVLHTASRSPRQASHGLARDIVRFLEGFVAGGVAGAVSKTVIAPGDRVKIIFQVDSARHFTLREAVRLGVHTVREFGITGLWIGNGATMLRVVPYAAITYASFDLYYSTATRVWSCVSDDGAVSERTAVYLRFLSGALAGATSTTFTYPLDLMRARFAARSSSGKTRFPSYRHAFREATAVHGVGSLYSGLLPTLVGIVPYAGCSFACFETIKYHIVKFSNLGSDRDIPAWQRLIAGGLSGLVAQSATYPLDIVRRRMQVTPGRYRNVMHALRTIHREEGLRHGMYKGLSMNWIKGPIATATSFTVNDIIKRRTRSYHNEDGAFAPRKSPLTLPELLFCGGVAAGLAKLGTLPLDRLKIMYQLGIADAEKTNAKGLRHLWHMLCRNPNVWSSAHVTMMRVVPYGALTYSFFDVFQTASERLLFSHYPTLATNFVAGAAAAALGTFLVYPLDLLRTRMAASCIPSFQSYFWLFRSVWRRYGVASLWEGCYLAMMGVGALAGIGFAVYEYLKERFHCQTFGERLAAGMAAGIAGQVVTYPLNVVKRCRQAERVTYSRIALRPFKSLFLKPSLYGALYRKMPFSWTLSSFTFGISFAFNDTGKDLIAAARRDILHDIVFTPATS